MTDPGYRHIVLVVDRSGSMADKREDTEGGIAAFLDDQARDSEAHQVRTTVSLYQFDSEYEPVYEMREISEVPRFELAPRGSTALLDAIGRTVNTTGARLAALSEHARPGSVVLVITTDGFENASREFCAADVKKMITHQQEVYGWTVVFLGADQDAVTAGSEMGVPQGQSLSYAGTNSGLAFAAVSGATSRSFAGDAFAFTEDERTSALGTPA